MLYIQNFCAFTQSGTLTPDSEWPEVAATTHRQVVEPSYAGVIPPMQLRRMSKPIKLGVSAVKSITQDLDISKVKAINVGSAYGLLQDSETFVAQVIEQQEQMLNPTAFIQSTHNTVAGAIALSLKCNAHNMTYVHKGHSVSLALLDANLMDVEEGDYIILGGIDELTPVVDTAIQSLCSVQTSEGACFLLLEEIKSANDSGIGIIADGMDFDIDVNVEDYLTQLIIEKALDKDTVSIVHNVPTLHHLGINYASFSGYYPTMHAFGIAYAAKSIQEKSTKNTVIVLSQYEKYISYTILQG